MKLRYFALRYVAVHYVTLHLTITCRCFWTTQVAVLRCMFVSAWPGALSLFKIVLGTYENRRFVPCLQRLKQFPYFTFIFHSSLQTLFFLEDTIREEPQIYTLLAIFTLISLIFLGSLLIAQIAGTMRKLGSNHQTMFNSSTCSHAETSLTPQTSQISSRLFLLL